VQLEVATHIMWSGQLSLLIMQGQKMSRSRSRSKDLRVVCGLLGRCYVC